MKIICFTVGWYFVRLFWWIKSKQNRWTCRQGGDHMIIQKTRCWPKRISDKVTSSVTLGFYRIQEVVGMNVVSERKFLNFIDKFVLSINKDEHKKMRKLCNQRTICPWVLFPSRKNIFFSKPNKIYVSRQKFTSCLIWYWERSLLKLEIYSNIVSDINII